ncbi:MAG: tripartite tricarboxylate transporter substrate binding protein [Ottowia sp.]|uniref:Bug family tripartite tricarboxylate transporter substrate binding protein n=1 Tax=Ottowia sp. TaxID=1898956 RepID=UPI003C78CDA8
MHCWKKIALSLAVALGGSSAALAQSDWPNKPIQFVVPAGAGGTTDIVARALGQALGERLGQSVVIDNRAGAGGITGVTYAAKARPDGYTVVVGTNTTLAANLFLYKSFQIDPVKDFAPVAAVVDTPFALMVPANSPYKSVSELIAAAKAKPGKLNYGSGTSSALLCTEMLKRLAGIDIVRVNYKASPQALGDLMAGEIDLVCEPLASGLANLNSGRLRTLAVTGEKRSSLAPNLPTVAESGVPGMNYSAWIGLWAPAGTPKEIVSRLTTEVLASLKDPEVQRKMTAASSTTRLEGAEALHAAQQAEIDKIRELSKTVRLVSD